MGNCVTCKKGDPGFTDEELPLDECTSSNQISALPLDNSKKARGMVHNHVIVSKECHVKLAVDRGSVIRPLMKANSKASSEHPTGRLKESQAGKAAADKKDSSQPVEEEKATPESDQEEKGWPGLKEYTHNYAANIFSAFKPKIMEVLKEKAKYNKAPVIGFDQSNLVLENRGAITDTYQILGNLGKGAFGEVHKVRHRISDKIYAMKIINKASCEEAANLLNEIEILKKLDHPNIVRLYEFAQDTRNYYLITEFCAGGELLNKILTLRSFSERIAAKIMKQLLLAVTYCHAKHVVHRDLKLENLVLESDDIQSNVKVIDFGTCKIFKPKERMRDITGTAYYIAPEVLHESYNEKCDIWSCGVIMYMLLTGCPPFVGSSNEEIMRKVEKGNVSFTGPMWKRVSQEAISLLKKMLTYNPKLRINAETALKDSWFARYENKKPTDTVEILGCVENLRAFRVNFTMQQAVFSYMAAHMINKDEEKKLREIFISLDQNHDGLLSVEELTEGYKLLFKGDINAAKEEAKKTLANIDINRNGTIDYNGNFDFYEKIIEFLMANLNKNDYLNAQNMKMAFDFFDENHDGNISMAELQRVFSGIKGEYVLKNIIGETDIDKDGQVISYEEFIAMMTKYVNQMENTST